MTPDPDAALGRRIGAAAIDLVLLAAVGVVLGLLLGETETTSTSARVELGSGPTLALLLLGFVYFGVSEALTGQTLGKRLLGVRVARADDGGRPGAGAIAIRTLLRIVDALPFLYLVGLIVVFATGRRRQRVGDLAARTTVVRA